MSQKKVVLRCENLAVGYRGKAVLSGVNCSFTEGQFTSLLGPNGAGKTTLLRTLSRHLQPVSGAVEIDGRPLSTLRQLELAVKMAVVLTDRVTPPLFSVFEFVALGRYPHTDFLGRLKKRDREAVNEALAAVHGEELAGREFTSLSDGERQKVLVARALAQEPQLLLLDEPTSHLDLKHRMEVLSILRELCATGRITVIASLHDVDIATRVSDQVILIRDGVVIDQGAPEEVLTSAVVSRLYDFTRASFNSRIGSLELQSDGSAGRVFALGGMGEGAVLYRLLTKSGYAVATGVLYDNDLDTSVAESLGAEIVAAAAGEPITEAALLRAEELISRCDSLVAMNGSCGGIYAANARLVDAAKRLGKPTFQCGEGGSVDKLSELPALIAAAINGGGDG